MATPNLRPADIDLLVSLVQRAKYTLNFDEVAYKLNITVNAASQRWGRLKTKIISRQKIELKGGDDLILLTNVAKQFGSADVDFAGVAADIGCANGGAASQRWNRLRLKIIGGKDGTVGSAPVKPNRPPKVPKVPKAAVSKVVKNKTTTKATKPKPVKKTLADAILAENEAADNSDDADADDSIVSQHPAEQRSMDVDDKGSEAVDDSKLAIDLTSEAEENEGTLHRSEEPDVPMPSIEKGDEDDFQSEYNSDHVHVEVKEYDDEY